jgi:hypothetical protein
MQTISDSVIERPCAPGVDSRLRREGEVLRKTRPRQHVGQARFAGDYYTVDPHADGFPDRRHCDLGNSPASAECCGRVR